MFRIIFHTLVALLVGIVGFYLYGAVLPQHAAGVVAAVIGGIELLSPVITKNHGLSIRLMAKVALPLLIWPLLAVAIEWSLRLDWVTGMAMASIGAVATGFLSAGQGSGRESLRLTGAGIATLIALYAIITTVVMNAPMLAMVSASIAVGVVVLVVYQAGVWPGNHERALLWAAGVCGCIAAVWGVADLMLMV